MEQIVTQVARLGVLGVFVLGMPALAVLTAHTSPKRDPLTHSTAPTAPTAPLSPLSPVAPTSQSLQELPAPELRSVNAPTGPQTPSSLQASTTEADDASGPAGSVRPSPDQPFPTPDEQAAAQQLQQQLIARGATAFVLEFDADSGSFIARCRVPLPTAANLTKAFHARDELPLPAIQSVLEQVQQWHQRVAHVEATRTQ